MNKSKDMLSCFSTKVFIYFCTFTFVSSECKVHKVVFMFLLTRLEECLTIPKFGIYFKLIVALAEPFLFCDDMYLISVLYSKYELSVILFGKYVIK